MAYRPDGRKVATSGWDGTVKVWDADTESLNLIFRAGTSGAYEPANIAFSPDGRKLALADDRGLVLVWDATTGRPLQTLKGHTGHANGVAFSPDGRKLASGDEDGTVKVWDAASGHELQTLKGHKPRVASVAFSPDGRLLASVGGISARYGEVKVWDLPRVGNSIPSAATRTRFPAWRSPPTAAAWPPPATIGPSSSGTRPPVRRSSRCGVIPAVPFAWRFLPTGNASPLGASTGRPRSGTPTQPDADHLLVRLVASRVAELFRTLLLKSDVIDRIRGDAKLDEFLRAAALRIAERTPEQPVLLNNTSWMIAQAEAHRTPEDYRRACDMPKPPAGSHRENPPSSIPSASPAIAPGSIAMRFGDLNRSLELNPPRFGGPIPADLAFVAMAQHRLGQKTEALMTLGRLREAMSRQPWSDDDESEAFADEANALIAGTRPPLVEVARFVNDSKEANEFATFSPDGRRVLSCAVDGTMRLWDRESAV